MRPRRGRRYALIGVAAALTIAAAAFLLRAHRAELAAVLALLAMLVSYLGGYYWTRKARRQSARQRGAVLAGALLLAVVLLAASWLVAEPSSAGVGALLAGAFGALVVFHLSGMALGRHKRKRRKPPGRESALAHKDLDGLRAVEIGGSIHNPFGLNTLNDDYTASTDTVNPRDGIAFHHSSSSKMSAPSGTDHSQ